MSLSFPSIQQKPRICGVFALCARHVYQILGASPEGALQWKSLAKSKGVVGNRESEGSWRQTFEPTNRN